MHGIVSKTSLGVSSFRELRLELCLFIGDASLPDIDLLPLSSESTLHFMLEVDLVIISSLPPGTVLSFVSRGQRGNPPGRSFPSGFRGAFLSLSLWCLAILLQNCQWRGWASKLQWSQHRQLPEKLASL